MPQPTLQNLFTDNSPVTGTTAQIAEIAVDSTGKILTTTFAEALTPIEFWSAIVLAGQSWLYQNTDASVNANASQLSQSGPTTRNGVSKNQVSIAIQLYTTATTPSVDVTQL